MIHLSLKTILAALFLGLSSQAVALSFSIPEHAIDDQFQWVNHDLGLPRIYAEGQIEHGDNERLSKAIADAGIDSGVVLFNSPGGSLTDGVLLGETIRKLGLSTGIAKYENGLMAKSGICASACAYAFAGGVHRYYEAGQQSLGVHQFYAAPDAKGISSGEAQEISGLLVAYLKTMGVDPVAFTVSSSAGPDGMFWLTTQQAEDLLLATNGVSQTTAELKQAQGSTYLAVEQDHADSLGRFLFFCSAGKIIAVGGYVTTPEDSRQKYDWATWSALKVDSQQIQRSLKDPKTLNQNDSMISAPRILSRLEVDSLLKSRSVGLVFGADGMVSYGSSADLSQVMEKVREFVANCYQL